MAKEYKITSLRLADLEKELSSLKTTREREIAAMIAEARSYGEIGRASCREECRSRWSPYH